MKNNRKKTCHGVTFASQTQMEWSSPRWEDRITSFCFPEHLMSGASATLPAIIMGWHQKSMGMKWIAQRKVRRNCKQEHAYNYTKIFRLFVTDSPSHALVFKMPCSIFKSKYIRITYKAVWGNYTSLVISLKPDGLVSDFAMSGYLWHNLVEIMRRENAWEKQAEAGIPRRKEGPSETRGRTVTEYCTPPQEVPELWTNWTDWFTVIYLV
jgi:hypothetical protein